MKKTIFIFIISTLFTSVAFAQNYNIQKLPPISGPKNISYQLEHSSEAVYSINAGLGNTTYVWTVPAGVHVTEDKGTSIKITFDKDFVYGVISVKMKDKKHNNVVRYIRIGNMEKYKNNFT
ncbi:MAG: hypothetical protein ABI402_10965 [Ferruginibacter sp.]